MKKKLLNVLLICSLIVGSLVGCGSPEANVATESKERIQSTDTSPGSSTDAGQGDVAATAANLPELTLGSAMSWETLTPFRTMRVWQIVYGRLLYDSLACYTSDGVLNPVVAKSWDVEPDGTTWDIEIYDYVYDSAGNHITADDIVWMLEEQAAQGLKPCFNQIDSVEKTGDYTFKIALKQDMVGVMDTILMHTFVVSKTAYESDPDGFNSAVISTAPYLLTEFVSGSSITLEKRDDYWQSEELIPASMANNVDKLTVKYISEASQQQIALETGEVDGFAAMTQSVIPSFEGAGFEVSALPSITGTILRFSGAGSRIVAEDENLRKAIAYAIDEQGIIQGVYGGYAQKMNGPEPAGPMGYQDSWLKEDNYNYDVEKAKEYLAQSNYNGETLELLASSSTANDRLGAMIQAYLLEIGVDLKLNIVERSLYTSMTYDGTAYDMIIMSNGATNLADLWSSSYDMNAYEGGDASGRHDEILTNMIYESRTNSGYTAENIEAVHQYLMEHLYDYGICQPQQCDIYNTSLGMIEQVPMLAGGLDFAACVYGN